MKIRIIDISQGKIEKALEQMINDIKKKTKKLAKTTKSINKKTNTKRIDEAIRLAEEITQALKKIKKTKEFLDLNRS